MDPIVKVLEEARRRKSRRLLLLTTLLLFTVLVTIASNWVNGGDRCYQVRFGSNNFEVFIAKGFSSDTNGVVTTKWCWPRFKHWKERQK